MRTRGYLLSRRRRTAFYFTRNAFSLHRRFFRRTVLASGGREPPDGAVRGLTPPARRIPGFSADENVIRHAKERQVAHAHEVFAEADHLKAAVQVGNVVGAGKDVIPGEPHRPAGT